MGRQLLQSGFIVAFLCVASLGAASWAFAQSAAPHFSGSDLPPPELEKPQAPSLYEIFTVGDVSPLGARASSVRPAELVDQAERYLHGSNGRQANPAEAAYWLKLLVAAGPNGPQERGWALLQLGLLAYNSTQNPQAGHVLARQLWELAGAWNQPDALCNLGALAEQGDDVEKMDKAKAIVWYTRAKKAGCAQADEALARLK